MKRSVMAAVALAGMWQLSGIMVTLMASAFNERNLAATNATVRLWWRATTTVGRACVEGDLIWANNQTWLCVTTNQWEKGL